MDIDFQAPLPNLADLRAAPAAPGSGVSRERLEESSARVAEEFEALFIAQMLAPMFETLHTDELFGGGPGEDMYRSLMVEEYGKAVAEAGGLGIAETLQREMLRLQEIES